jgi:Diguanylate cyclase, GGDEF domain
MSRSGYRGIDDRPDRYLQSPRPRLHLAKAVTDAAKRRDNISLVMPNVDRFKRFNDDFGHAAGDEVPQRTAVLPDRAARPREIDRWVFPSPGVPLKKSTLAFCSMKLRWNRFWICGRLIFFGQLHWN